MLSIKQFIRFFCHYFLCLEENRVDLFKFAVYWLCLKLFFLFLKKWLQATDLTREVYQHLAHYVPKIYCRGPNPFPQKEDMLAHQVLLGPMEWYLCGEDPELGFSKLEQTNKPSHLCGRVFKVGEPTYSCR